MSSRSHQRSRTGPAGARPRTRAAADPARAASGFAAGTPWTWSAALAAALFAVYVALAPHVSGDKDASEFTLVLATGGVLHPTGYPLYTLIGHAFVVAAHALGAGYPFAANLWVAVGGGVALFLLHRLALRLLPGACPFSRAERFLLAALPVIVLAFNPVWMVECTMVEVHSWQMAWGLGALLVLTGLLGELERGGAAVTGLGRRMAGWGLLCGLGGAHHTTSVFLAGGMTLALVVALARAKRLHAWVPLVWLAAGLVPLASYAWVGWRAFHPGEAFLWPPLEPTVRSVLGHVTASAYHVWLGRWAPGRTQLAWLQLYLLPFLVPGFALLAAQCWSARGARRLAFGALLLAAAAQTAFTFRYGVPDPDAYFLPPLAAALLALAAAAGGVLVRLRASRAALATALVAVIALLGVWGVLHVRMLAVRKDALTQADTYFHAMWSQVPDGRALVLWPRDEFCMLKEYQRFLGEKPHLDVQCTGMLFYDRPRELFRQRYGFDPLALVDREHLAAPLRPEYVIGQQDSPAQAHEYALVHQCLAERSSIPVVAFDPPRPTVILPGRADPQLLLGAAKGR
jgi:hypothetical protein